MKRILSLIVCIGLLGLGGTDKVSRLIEVNDLKTNSNGVYEVEGFVMNHGDRVTITNSEGTAAVTAFNCNCEGYGRMRLYKTGDTYTALKWTYIGTYQEYKGDDKHQEPKRFLQGWELNGQPISIKQDRRYYQDGHLR